MLRPLLFLCYVHEKQGDRNMKRADKNTTEHAFRIGMRHYVYVIECVNGNYYTGYTTDVARRYLEHQAGSIKCKYTRAFPPKKLAAVWGFDNKSDALHFEYYIKSLTRKEKEVLVLERASTAEDKAGRMVSIVSLTCHGGFINKIPHDDNLPISTGLFNEK